MTIGCCPIPRPIGAIIPGSEDSWAHDSRVGPFMAIPDGSCEFSNRWCFIVRDEDNLSQLLAWVTDDQGANWDIADPTGFTELTDGIVSFDCEPNKLNANLIDVGTQEESSGRVSYHQFSLSSKTWVQVNSELNPPSVLNGPPIEEVFDETTTFSAGFPTWASDANGEYLSFASTFEALTLARTTDQILTTNKLTVFIIRRLHDTSAWAGQLFGPRIATDPQRCNAWCPFSDGTVIWDFGDSGGTNRLTWGGYARATGVEAWVFRDGPSGKAIFLNGVKEASDANASTRTNASVAFNLNRGKDLGAPQDMFFFAIVPDEVSDAVCATFTNATVTSRQTFWDSLVTAGFSPNQVLLFDTPSLATDAFKAVNGTVSVTSNRDTGLPIIGYDSTPEFVTADLYDRFLVRQRLADTTWDASLAWGRIGQTDQSMLSRIVSGLDDRVHAWSKSHNNFAIQNFDVQTLKSDTSLSGVTHWGGTGLSGADTYYIGTPDTYLDSVLQIVLPLRVGGQLDTETWTDADGMVGPDTSVAGALVWYGSDSSLKPSVALKYTDSLHTAAFRFSLGGTTWIIYDASSLKYGPIMPIGTPREFDALIVRAFDDNWIATLLATGSGIKFELLAESSLPTPDISFADWILSLETQDVTIDEDCPAAFYLCVCPGPVEETQLDVSLGEPTMIARCRIITPQVTVQ